MLTPQQVIDSEYLESRCALLEIAAMFDRYDRAVIRSGEAAQHTKKLECLRTALSVLAQSDHSEERAEKLLELVATI